MEPNNFGFWYFIIFSSIGLCNTIYFIINFLEKRGEEKRKIKEILEEYEKKKKSDWRNF